MMTFRLKIELGNDAMQNGHDIATALRTVIAQLDLYGDVTAISSNIRDLNGNTVGDWKVSRK